MTEWSLYCCGCKEHVAPRLTNGAEVYPHRPDLSDLPYWKCDACGNWVGCHHKTKNPTRPLGVIPTPEIKNARQKLHRVIDPLWKGGGWRRTDLYAEITKRIGWKYHSAEVRSVEEADRIYAHIKDIRPKRTTNED